MKQVFLLILMSILGVQAVASAEVTQEQVAAVKEKYRDYIFALGRDPQNPNAIVVNGVGISNCPGKPKGLHLSVYVVPEKADLVKTLLAPEIEGVPTCVQAMETAHFL
jgi:hypothetical protein